MREVNRRNDKEQNQKAIELWKCRGCGKRGKPKAGFPRFSRAPWKSRPKAARFPHFHSSGGEGGWEKGKTKTGFPPFPPPRLIWGSRTKNRARGGWLPYLEIAVGTYFLGMVVFAITTFNFLSIPFLALFVFGYYWAGFTTLYQEHQNRLRWLRARNLELARQA